MIGNVSINFPIKNEFNSVKIDVLFSTNVLHILLIIETSTVHLKYMTAFKVKGKEQKAGKVFLTGIMFSRGGKNNDGRLSRVKWKHNVKLRND